jgi:parallel beta-helix repeat protein
MTDHLGLGRNFGLCCIVTLAAALAVLMGSSSSQARAAEVACGDVITQDTKVGNDLVNCPGDGLVIGADDVTLDLRGHTIDGVGEGTGIAAGAEADVIGPTRVTIANGTVRDFADGVGLRHSDASHIRKLTVSGNSHGGIELFRSQTPWIEQNRVFENGRGVNALFGYAERIEGNRVFDNAGAGVGVAFTSKAVVAANFLSGNGIGADVISESRFDKNVVLGSEIGLSIGSAKDNVVQRNKVLGGKIGLSISTFTSGNETQQNLVAGNSEVGINLGHSEGDSRSSPNRIEQNLVYGNGDGIRDSDDGSSVVAKNRIESNRGNGISTGVPTYNFQILGNRISRNGSDGVFVTEPNFSGLVAGNTVTRNGDDGIEVDAPSTTVTDNRTRKNADLGIDAISGTVDGGGNRGFGNGNPLECLNIACVH